MSHVLTTTGSYDSILVPDPGDPRTASSVNTAFQALGNRDDFIRSKLPTNFLPCSPVISCSDGVNISVAPIPCIFLNGQAYSSSTGFNLTTANGPGGGTALSTWYYIYATAATGSVLSCYLAADAPANGGFRTGFPNDLYLGAAKTSAANLFTFFNKSGNQVLYTWAVTSPPQVTSITSIALQTGSFDAFVPSHVKQVWANIEVSNTSSTTPPTVFLYYPTIDSYDIFYGALSASINASSNLAIRSTWIGLDSHKQFYYVIGSTVGSPVIATRALGYIDIV